MGLAISLLVSAYLKDLRRQRFSLLGRFGIKAHNVQELIYALKLKR